MGEQRMKWSGVAVLLVGCASTTTTPATTPEAGVPAAPVDEAVPGIQLTLHDAGTEPRQALRFKLQTGAQQTMVMRLRMELAMDLAGKQGPATEVPTIAVTMTMQVQSVEPDGSYRYAFELAGVEVEGEASAAPEVVASLRHQLGALVGIKGTSTATARGFVRAVELELPSNPSPQLAQMMDSMRQSMAQMSTPFPAEPVGMDARWSVAQTVNSGGMTLRQTTTYQLRSLNQDLVDADVTVSQTAEEQVMSLPGLPPGAQMRLVSMAGEGSGTVSTKLSQLAPVRSEIGIKSNVSMDMTIAGEKQRMSMRMTVQVTLEGSP